MLWDACWARLYMGLYRKRAVRNHVVVQSGFGHVGAGEKRRKVKLRARRREERPLTVAAPEMRA